MISYQESIRPSADLRNHYNEISKQCKEENEICIITVNGRGDTVTMSYEEYKRLKAKIEVLERLAYAEKEIEKGNIISSSDVEKELDELFKEEYENI